MTSMGATEPAAPAASASPPSAPPAPVLTPVPPEAPAARRLGYHPELDGLRGVALAIVVLHHAALLMWPGHPDWFFPGGQVGLDVFFALSGFLITALLLGEHRKRGTVRVGNFLWRRLLRLWPALVGLQVGMLIASVATDRYPPGEG